MSLLLFGLVDADHLMVGGHGPVNPNDIALQANIHQVHINIHSVILDHWCLSLGLGAGKYAPPSAVELVRILTRAEGFGEIKRRCFRSVVVLRVLKKSVSFVWSNSRRDLGNKITYLRLGVPQPVFHRDVQ